MTTAAGEDVAVVTELDTKGGVVLLRSLGLVGGSSIIIGTIIGESVS